MVIMHRCDAKDPLHTFTLIAWVSELDRCVTLVVRPAKSVDTTVYLELFSKTSALGYL